MPQVGCTFPTISDYQTNCSGYSKQAAQKAVDRMTDCGFVDRKERVESQETPLRNLFLGDLGRIRVGWRN
jgi:hypothetical protein